MLRTVRSTMYLGVCSVVFGAACQSPPPPSTTPPPAAVTAPAPAAQAATPTSAAAPTDADVKRYEKDEAEMLDNAPWMEYRGPKGEVLMLRFYSKPIPELKDEAFYVDAKFGSDAMVTLSKATERNGAPVFGSGDDKAITLISLEGGAKAEVTRGSTKKIIYTMK